MIDYIIVGLGLSGIAFCETLEKHNKSYRVFDHGKNSSSIIAAGLYNPVNLKRFTAGWNTDEQLEKAMAFYTAIENKFQIKINNRQSIFRIFYSIEEQNMWFYASDKPLLKPYLSQHILKSENENILAPYGLGEVISSGFIDTKLLISTYREYLAHNKLIYNKPFDYERLMYSQNFQYDILHAKNIVFAEGYGMKQNPFFNHLPLPGNKGEIMTIKAPSLKLTLAIKQKVFIIPLGNDYYRVGATYHWTDKTWSTTDEAREELVASLKKIIKCSFEIIDHQAAIRPTVIDRKPLVGKHPQYKNMYLLNGLGTRGVSIAPTVAEQLYQYIENKVPLNPDIDCNRFAKI